MLRSAQVISAKNQEKEFYRHMDAANIDLKGFTEHFYHKICHGHLRPVLDTLLYLKKETDVWFEITTLLIPGENDSDTELNAMCQWIFENLGANVPLHFSAFHPDFKMLDKGRTPLSTLLRAWISLSRTDYTLSIVAMFTIRTPMPPIALLAVNRSLREIGINSENTDLDDNWPLQPPWPQNPWAICRTKRELWTSDAFLSLFIGDD
ncbi:hypothetical protein P4S64_20875 [Vibrio sp. M60_M31a]